MRNLQDNMSSKVFAEVREFDNLME